MTSLHRLGFSGMLIIGSFLFFGAGSGSLAADADRIEKLISQLGSDNFREREAAAIELNALRDETLPALRKATESNDPEVKRAATALIGTIEARLAAEARATVAAVGGKVRDWEEGEAFPPNSVRVYLSTPIVSDDDLKCLKWIGRVDRLELNDTQISDAGLAHLEGLTELRELNLNGSKQITDAGLVSLRKLAKLTFLDLNFTKVTDKGLAHLRELGSLGDLRLCATGVEGHGLAHLKKMRRLRVALAGSRVTDAGLAGVKELAGLELFYVGYTGISDEGLKHLAECQSLTSLILSSTKITDAGLAHLKGLVNLKSLTLALCIGVTDKGLGHLKGLSKLEYLNLRRLPITDKGIPALLKLTDLKDLNLHETAVTDKGALQLKALRNLERLILNEKTVTADAVAELRKALPEASISR